MDKKDFKMKIVKLVEMKKQKRNVQNAKLFNIVREIVKNIIGLCIRNIVQKSKVSENFGKNNVLKFAYYPLQQIQVFWLLDRDHGIFYSKSMW